jgi:hypothetical protein
MRIDVNNIDITDDELRDLMIYYITKDRQADFERLYKSIYKDANSAEMARCAFFVRLGLGLSEPFRGY